MVMSNRIKKDVDSFFDSIDRQICAYEKSSLSYVAIKKEDDFVVIRGVLFLNAADSRIQFKSIKSERILAGHFLVSDLGLSPRGVVENLFSGSLQTPEDELVFPGESAEHYSTYFSPFLPEALQNQSRISTLTIAGASQTIDTPQLDWELKAASTPYDSLQELMSEFSLGTLRDGAVSVDVIAHNVAVIDDSSSIEGEAGKLAVRLSHGLPPEKASVGYRVFSQGRVVERIRVEGRRFRWKKEDDYQLGTLEVTVPKAAVLQCFANFDGIAQHAWWVTDPSTVQNPRRTAYETFDSQLERLKEIFSREQARGHDARDLEAAIAWLMWMLGFSVANLNTTRTHEAPDLIATAPNGHFVVVECTAGLLKAENKLSHLFERTQAVRRSLDASGNRHIRVIPIIVTTKKRDDVATELEAAEQHGILVLTREDIDGALEHSIVVPNADQFFDRAEKTIRNNQEKHKAQGVLPLQA